MQLTKLMICLTNDVDVMVCYLKWYVPEQRSLTIKFQLISPLVETYSIVVFLKNFTRWVSLKFELNPHIRGTTFSLQKINSFTQKVEVKGRKASIDRTFSILHLT